MLNELPDRTERDRNPLMEPPEFEVTSSGVEPPEKDWTNVIGAMRTDGEDKLLLEVSPYETDAGQLIGRDPRQVEAKDWQGREWMVGLKAIRAKCLDCCCDNASEVRKCTATGCPLWPLRMGSVPRGYRNASSGREGV